MAQAAAAPLIIAAVAAAAASTLQAVAAVQQGKVASETSKFNSELLRRRAEQEQITAEQQANDERRRGSRIRALARANLAGSGVTFEGTPLLRQEDFASEVELSARRIEVGGNIRSNRLRQESALELFRGRNARRQSFFRAGTSILSGISQAASTSAGAFGSGGAQPAGISSLGGQGAFAIAARQRAAAPSTANDSSLGPFRLLE